MFQIWRKTHQKSRRYRERRARFTETGSQSARTCAETITHVTVRLTFTFGIYQINITNLVRIWIWLFRTDDVRTEA